MMIASINAVKNDRITGDVFFDLMTDKAKDFDKNNVFFRPCVKNYYYFFRLRIYCAIIFVGIIIVPEFHVSI